MDFFHLFEKIGFLPLVLENKLLVGEVFNASSTPIKDILRKIVMVMVNKKHSNIDKILIKRKSYYSKKMTSCTFPSQTNI